MKVLIDECLPRRLKLEWSRYEVYTVAEMGWAGKKDIEVFQLLSDQFDVFFTVETFDRELLHGSTFATKRPKHFWILTPDHNTPTTLKSTLFEASQDLKLIDAGLYELSLEAIELSAETIRIIQPTGITTIGDCIAFFADAERDGNSGVVRWEFVEAMFEDVKPKLEEKGYWPLDED